MNGYGRTIDGNKFHFFKFLILLLSCSHRDDFDLQGHRGAVGLFPENSIIGFIETVKLGVTTLEMDVVITKDNKVLVSHEPWISNKKCIDIRGNDISCF